ncbi:hypothetical protein DPMN_000510 [Dreissena polymorpha]|uniref:Uncharacterized protein n=1 Tax=Dreissena polymorpha TaxID=45954 RepID=A0A9D4RS57_DREPO|nr:hypothetical protein DPMN_000510 [Dreissena polymorpha]
MDQQVLQSYPGRSRWSCAPYRRCGVVFGDIYLQMSVSCVLCPREASRSRSRRVGWRLRVTCEPVPVQETDGNAFLKHAQSGHRCRRHGNSYSVLSGTGTILGKGCAQVLAAGNLFQLLAVHCDVCAGVCRTVHYNRRLLRAYLNHECSCSFMESVGKILKVTAGATI